MTNDGHKKVESVKKPVVKEQAPATKPTSSQSGQSQGRQLIAIRMSAGSLLQLASPSRSLAAVVPELC